MLRLKKRISTFRLHSIKQIRNTQHANRYHQHQTNTRMWPMRSCFQVGKFFQQRKIQREIQVHKNVHKCTTFPPPAKEFLSVEIKSCLHASDKYLTSISVGRRKMFQAQQCFRLCKVTIQRTACQDRHVCLRWLRHSVVSDSVTPWTVAWQAPLSMGFSSQEYWSRLPFPTPGILPNPGIETVSRTSLASAGRFFYPWRPWEAQCLRYSSTIQ